MTVESAQSGLAPLSNLKAAPTTFSSKSVALRNSSNLQAPAQLSNRPQSQKNVTRDEPLSATSDKATVALIRRVLCPQAGAQPLEELLPPLTSSNEVDLQLYALLAIIIKEFVFSWYLKITSDQALAQEVIQVIAHCTRALEQRLRETDIAQLVFDDISGLVETHITSYRLARDENTLSGLSPSAREIYHALNPHPSLSPIPSDPQTIAEQGENEAIYRQLLVQGLLAVLLPTEDLENACLRTLVCDILADLIIGTQVSDKFCQGWFLWETISKLLAAPNRVDKHTETADDSQHDQLQKFGLLSVNEESKLDNSSSRGSFGPTWLWNILQILYLTFTAMQFIVIGLFRVARNPSKDFSSSSSVSDSSLEHDKMFPSSIGTIRRPVLSYRIYGLLSELLDISQRMPWLEGSLALIQHLTLAGPGRLGSTGSVLDRFLHETIQDYILTPTLLPNLLLTSRAALFPSNARPDPPSSQRTDVNRISTPAPQPPQVSVHPPTPPPEQDSASDATPAAPGNAHAHTTPLPMPSGSLDQAPSAPEIAAIKRECAARILSLVPQPVARGLFGVSAGNAGSTTSNRSQGNHIHQQQQSSRASSPVSTSSDDTEELLLLETIENNILDLFADEYCNKHLIYSIIETVLVRLLPELSESSVAELMEDRGVTFVTHDAAG